MSSDISNLAAPIKLRMFGEFSLDPTKKVLWRHGKPVSLPLKAVEILCILVSDAGSVVTKDEILAAVWKDTFVEESNLTNNISQLRKTFKQLGEDNLIETIPGRGYRFVGEVQDIYERDEITIERRAISQTLIAGIPVADQAVLPSAVRPWRMRSMVAIVVIAAAAGLSIWAWTWNTAPKRISLSDINAIAVLPPRSFDGEADENLRVRLMDSMITNLGNLESLTVRPTSSTMRFLKPDENSLDIGRRLGVDAILEGAVQRENDKIRITLQLVSVGDGVQIWSQQFDGRADRLLDLQNAVSAELAAILGTRLSSKDQESVARHPTENAEAYEEYLKGRYQWNKRTAEGLQSAVQALENAISLDADFALAHAALADVYCVFPEYSDFGEKEAYRLARIHAARALEINPGIAEAHTSLAFVEFWGNKDLAESQKMFLRAIAVNPNYPTARHWYANVLLASNDLPEAVKQMTRAQKLDPLSLVINTELGILHYYSRDYGAAESQFQHTLEIEPAFHRASVWLGRVLTMSRRYDEALTVYGSMPREIAARDGSIAEIGYTKGLANDREGAQGQLRDLIQRSGSEKNAFSSAIICVALGEQERAVEFLEKAALERESDLAYLHLDPIFDPLRADAEFIALSERYR